MWFKELPSDDESMEKTLIDSKLGNLLGVLKWDIQAQKQKTHLTHCLTWRIDEYTRNDRLGNFEH